MTKDDIHPTLQTGQPGQETAEGGGCPFCGAAYDQTFETWCCRSYIKMNGNLYQSEECKNTEIAQLKERLAKVEKQRDQAVQGRKQFRQMFMAARDKCQELSTLIVDERMILEDRLAKVEDRLQRLRNIILYMDTDIHELQEKLEVWRASREGWDEVWENTDEPVKRRLRELREIE